MRFDTPTTCTLILMTLITLPVLAPAEGKQTGLENLSGKTPGVKSLKGATTISPGQCIDGELASGDDQLQDNTFFDAYTLNWPGGALEITHDSAQFDEYLIVFTPDGSRTDVDTAEGTPPEVFSLSNAPSGTYTIWANSYTIATGSYELCVSESLATPTPTPCVPEPTPFAPLPADGVAGVSTTVELSWNKEPIQKVIYGADDRLDIYQVSDPDLVSAFESTVVLLQPSEITDNGNGTYTLDNVPWTSVGGTQLCPTEPFLGQPNPGFCSGFLVGPDLVATAGHCITGEAQCGETFFVFGFQMISSTTPVLTVPASNVYRCAGVEGRVFSGATGEDWSLVRLDRPVEGRDPLPIRREGTIADNQGLVMIGYPSGLPGKVAGGANVRTNTNPFYFVANTDSYGGNSGSAVLNAQTLEVEGILVRGESDFVNAGGCVRSNQCADNACRGEDITRITLLADQVPAPPQFDVYFGPCGNLQLLGTTSRTSWPVSGLIENTTYCWRIDAANTCSTSQGPVWSFSTGLVLPPTSTPTPIPTAEQTETNTPTPLETPTETAVGEPCDSGYYILDSFGGRHRVGNPTDIVGPIYFGLDIARDLEKANCSVGPASDLVVLDGFGVAHFVTDTDCDVPQDFYFDDDPINFPQGRAVDLQMTADSAGFWVLTDFGEIYLAGSALGGGSSTLEIGQTGVLGFDIPTPRTEGTSNLTSNGTSLRAVSLVALDEDGDSRSDGYVVLDSMGGQFRYEADGTEVVGGSRAGEPENDPEHLLDPDSYPWPFFPGLDIARDMELHPTQQGVVILDGWDGIHPVPAFVPSNPVWFAQNENPQGGPAQSVGMPYIIQGFNDPSTGADESDPTMFGIDAESIFIDLEFSAGCPDGGLYTLDKFGGVFALGAARPVETETAPGFGGSPYFFPFFRAISLEVFEADETD